MEKEKFEKLEKQNKQINKSINLSINTPKKSKEPLSIKNLTQKSYAKSKKSCHPKFLPNSVFE